MTKRNLISSSALAAVALSGTAFAGEIVAPAPEPTNNGSWCDGFETLGKFYSNKDNPYIQSFKFFGRFHWTGAHIDGEDVNGDSFSDTLDEVRRFRLGAELKFLNGFKLKGNVNLVDDRVRTGGGRDFEYTDWDELTLSYTFKDVAGFDELALIYGRHKVGIGPEAYESSKEIKTVERSALSNKIFNGRWTGLEVEMVRGDWTGIVGYYGQDENEALGSVNDGGAFYLRSEHKVGDSDLAFDFFYNLEGGVADPEAELANYEWVATIAWETEIGNWNLLLNAIYGDNGDSDYQSNADREGSFYGVVIMPSTYLIEDKLEFVARYAWQGSSESEGIRAHSRYFRASVLDADVNSGRGDSHHSIYAGLNYFLCGHNAKVMAGVEFETLDTPVGDADAITLWTAFRTYF